jgi:hypothetical protein
MNNREARVEQETGKAVRKYFRAMVRGRTPVRRDNELKEQLAGYETAARAGFELGERVKEIIGRHGASRIQFPLYRTFALHLARLQRSYSADDFALMCCAAINRWTGYGLSNKVLRELCREIFGVQV